MSENIEDQVKTGVIAGFKAIAENEEVMQKFWKGGFDELVKHGSNASTQWVGKRVLTWFAVLTVGLAMTWLVKSGAIK
jgi:hypothetical protein